MKKIAVTLLALILSAVFLSACGSKEPGVDPDTHKITVYRYQALGDVDGTEDEKVMNALADKFYADTGIKIKLQVDYYSHSVLPTKVDSNWTKKSADMDGVLHYISEDHGCATLRYATSKDTVRDFEPLVSEYGQNIMKYLSMNDENAVRRMSCYTNVEGEFKMNYLVTAKEENLFGLLVRKDYMREVQSITGLDPEKYDALNENYEHMTITQFSNLLYALKQHFDSTQLKYPLVGAPWDINYTIAPALEADCYSIQQEADGKYAPAQFSPQVAEWYDLIQQWAADGVWESEAASVADSMRRSWFVAGQAAVYAAYPTVENIITAKRYLEKNNPSAEYMVIAPLADKNGVVHGYGNNGSPDGLIIPNKADDAEVLVQYIDWLYSDPDNYELAEYGIKGEHWVEGEDRVVGGKTYKTWVYPDGKEDQFNENPPYSGKYNLLENIYVSHRVRGDYDTTELTWYDLITDKFEVYHNNKIEGIWIGSCPREFASQFNVIDGNYVDNVRSYPWAGLLNDGKTASECLNEYVTSCHAQQQGYLDWLNELVAKAKQFKQSKFGV